MRERERIGGINRLINYEGIRRRKRSGNREKIFSWKNRRKGEELVELID